MSHKPLIEWDNIDTVLLDMDGTLLDLNFDNHFWNVHLPKRYQQINGGELEQTREYLAQKILSKKGTQLWYDLDYWSLELGLDIYQLKNEVRHLIKPLADTHTFLTWAVNQNKTLYIVTNAHHQSIQIKMQEIDLLGYVKRLVSAFEYGYPKESTEFWPLLQKELGYHPERTIFIDDNIAVLEAAQQSNLSEVVEVCCPDSTRKGRQPQLLKSVNTLAELLPK